MLLAYCVLGFICSFCFFAVVTVLHSSCYRYTSHWFQSMSEVTYCVWLSPLFLCKCVLACFCLCVCTRIATLWEAFVTSNLSVFCLLQLPLISHNTCICLFFPFFFFFCLFPCFFPPSKCHLGKLTT